MHAIFQKMDQRVKMYLKKKNVFGNLGKNVQKFENIFKKGSLMRVTIACMKQIEYALIKHVDVFVAWKDVKFQKSCNFPGNTNFKRLLLDLLKIKRYCSY